MAPAGLTATLLPAEAAQPGLASDAGLHELQSLCGPQVSGLADSLTSGKTMLLHWEVLGVADPLTKGETTLLRLKCSLQHHLARALLFSTGGPALLLQANARVNSCVLLPGSSP